MIIKMSTASASDDKFVRYGNSKGEERIKLIENQNKKWLAKDGR